MTNFDDSALREIVTGRVEPHIYSFETNTLPNLLKVGDTYRPVEERLKEWRKYYANLEEVSRHSALIADEVYFRDHAVHRYLEEVGVEREAYAKERNIFSNEFFKSANKQHIDDAVQDIQKNYKRSTRYDYYNGLKKLEEAHYSRSNEYMPRPNQQEVIDKFNNAREAGRTNLLMYAVMRFGKSITSMWCAKEMDAKVTVIVSAKADVKEEWQKTIESDKSFKSYRFMDSAALSRHPDISSIFGSEFELGDGEKEICTNIVLFFTLQDIAGSTNAIKKRHETLRDNKIDLLIIDETHFGARAPLLGKILAGNEITQEDKKALDDANSEDDVEDFGQINKLQAINAEIKLHLSGTPYRILMGGEFKPEDIIAFVQFADIYKAKLAWNEENIGKDEVEDEWKNPYFGFPQMIRFAFNPNESSRKLLEDMAGSSPADVLAPTAIKKDAAGKYRQLKHESEVVELLQVLDGTRQDANMLGLLGNESVKNGKLARHIVFALPYRASCDALEKLITENASKFKNLSNYKIINAAGHDVRSAHDTSSKVKSAIENAENSGEKTITLTVNKMLTGVTVPQWDTMIYLKATMSPQDYDQAIFRLQSPWIKKYYDDAGDEIKRDMKPQTLLVDLYPVRMFQVQEQKALVYGVNTGQTGNGIMKENIQQDLEISPIIRINVELNKLEEVTPANIMDAVRQYESTRAIVDEVREISVDMSLRSVEQLAAIIDSYPELGSKAGIIREKPVEGDGGDLSPGDEVSTGKSETDEEPSTPTTNGDDTSNSTAINADLKKFENKLRTLYLLILLFAFLSDTKEESFRDVIDSLDATTNNKRLAKNLGLDKQELKQVRQWINGNTESQLDYRIQNADVRAGDDSISPSERIDLAIHKFGKISDSEIFTPKDIVDKMYGVFDEDFWRDIRTSKVLDIASKSGSFANGYVRQTTTRGFDVTEIANNFYSIPTSRAAYEFTRKTYETLGLNVDNIAKNITAYELIELTENEVKYLLGQDKKFCDITSNDLKGYNKEQDESEGSVKFAAVVGNPPYQANIVGRGDQPPIYHLFLDRAYELSGRVAAIHPARFLFNAGLTPKPWNKKMLQDEHLRVDFFEQKSANVFANTDIKGGIAITYRDENQNFGAIDVFTSLPELNSILHRVEARREPTLDKLITGRGIYRLTNVALTEHSDIEKLQSTGHKTDVGSSAFKILNDVILFEHKPNDKKEYVQVIGLLDGKRKYFWIDRRYLSEPDNFEKYKIVVPKANGSGAIGEILSTPLIGEPLIGEPLIGYTETFIGIGAFETEIEAGAALKYIKSKFARTLLGMLKITQDNPRGKWAKVPVQDFSANSDIDWSKSIYEIDQQLYDKYGLSQTERNFIEDKVKAME